MDFTEIIKSLYLHTANVALFILGLNVLICILYFKRFNVPFRRLGIFLIFNFLIELLAILFTAQGINNLPLLHLYTLGEFILLSIFYESIIPKRGLIKKYQKHFLILGILLILLNSIFIQSIFEFNNLAKTFVQISIISYAVLYFYNLTENKKFNALQQKSLRLINSAILIYYSGSLFIFMCSQISFENTETYTLFWTFNAALNAIFQLLIFWSLWKISFKKIIMRS